MTESRTADLWLRIDQLHLKFLQAEETPAKLDIRKKLEGLVGDYLCIVPQERKFVSPTTGDLIANSVKWRPEFSLVKAANAFRAVEQYAANLINQPWRQEFWTIRQYSGFYKHSVETALSGADKLFVEMGYRVDTSTPQILSLPTPRTGEHPVGTDAVTSVARDCLLACVECNLLADILAGVEGQALSIEMMEVVEFRRDHIGSVDQAVRELIYRKNQQRYLHFPTPNHNYGLAPYYQPHFPGTSLGSYPGGQIYQQQHVTNGFQPLANGLPGALPGYQQNNGYHVPSHHVPSHHVPSQHPVSNHVPTGRLVDMEAGHHVVHNSPSGGSSTTSTLRQSQIPTTILDLGTEEKPAPPERRIRGEGGARPRDKKKRASQGEKGLEDWDYVYKQLEQSGYTKDQAERPDVLARDLLANTPSSLGRERGDDEDVVRGVQGLRLGSQGVKGMGEVRRVNQRNSKVLEQVLTSESEQERSNSRYSSAVSQGRQESEERERARQVDTWERGEERERARHVDTWERGEERERARHVPVREQLWECSTCTFHNRQSRNICEMCSKSKDCSPPKLEPSPVIQYRRQEPDKAPSPSPAGIACEKCTLVNPPNAKICAACDCTLGKTPVWRASRTSQHVKVKKRRSPKFNLPPPSNNVDEFPPLPLA